jgi:hypothetical protein
MKKSTPKAKKAEKNTSKAQNTQEPSNFYPEIYPSPGVQIPIDDVNSQIQEYFRYRFNNNYKLISVVDNTEYKFGDDYDSLGTYVVLFIQCLIKNMGLQEIWIPDNSPSINIFMTQDFTSNPNKLLVIIQGRGEVRAGQWSRKVCINEDLNMGSMIPYIGQGICNRYSIIVLNPNFNKDFQGNPIPGNSSMIEHTEYVWEKFIASCPAKNICIVAHSCGGVCTLHLIKLFFKDFLRRVKAIALLDSVHKTVAELSLEQKKFFEKVSQNWKKSKKPLGADVPSPRTEGCKCVSAGDPRHEYTSGTAFPAVFDFLENNLKRKI